MHLWMFFAIGNIRTAFLNMKGTQTIMSNMLILMKRLSGTRAIDPVLTKQTLDIRQY